MSSKDVAHEHLAKIHQTLSNIKETPTDHHPRKSTKKLSPIAKENLQKIKENLQQAKAARSVTMNGTSDQKMDR